MSVLEVLLSLDSQARKNVNRRAADLSLGHLINIGDRVLKLAPMAIVPAARAAMKKPSVNWAPRVAGLALPVIGKKAVVGRLAGGAATLATHPSTAVAASAMITPANALLLAAGVVGIDRLVRGLAARALRPRALTSPIAARITSLQDGRCLATGGLGLGFARCGAAGTEEWRFVHVRLPPGARQAMLGLVHGVDGMRLFVAQPPRQKAYVPAAPGVTPGASSGVVP